MLEIAAPPLSGQSLKAHAETSAAQPLNGMSPLFVARRMVYKIDRLPASILRPDWSSPILFAM
jgi:hypothetical protein